MVIDLSTNWKRLTIQYKNYLKKLHKPFRKEPLSKVICRLCAAEVVPLTVESQQKQKIKWKYLEQHSSLFLENKFLYSLSVITTSKLSTTNKSKLFAELHSGWQTFHWLNHWKNHQELKFQLIEMTVKEIKGYVCYFQTHCYRPDIFMSLYVNFVELHCFRCPTFYICFHFHSHKSWQNRK